MLVHIFPSLFIVANNLVREAGEIKGIKNETEKLEKQNKEIEAQIEPLKKGKGWEEEARAKGWVKEGEIFINVDDSKLPKPPEKKENLFQVILRWLEKRQE